MFRYFVNGKMRGVLVDWLIEVHSQFKLLQETLYMTVYVIDKFLQVMILWLRYFHFVNKEFGRLIILAFVWRRNW